MASPDGYTNFIRANLAPGAAEPPRGTTPSQTFVDVFENFDISFVREAERSPPHKLEIYAAGENTPVLDSTARSTAVLSPFMEAVLGVWRTSLGMPPGELQRRIMGRYQDGSAAVRTFGQEVVPLDPPTSRQRR